LLNLEILIFIRAERPLNQEGRSQFGSRPN